jgi:hypothetical protein
VISDDQVIVLLGKANPVPSLDLLDPIEPIDLDHLTETSERSSEMSNVQTTSNTDEKGQRRGRLTPVLVSLGAVLVAIPLIWRGVTSVDGSPVGVADSFMLALADRDWDSIEPLFAPELDTGQIEGMVHFDEWEFDRAHGWMYSNQGCVELSQGSGGALVECQFLVESDWTRALGLEPGTGRMSLLVEDGHIQSLTLEPGDPGGVNEAGEAFRSWVEENHPEDIDKMYTVVGGPILDSEATALFRQHTDEFVAELEAGG